MGRLFGSRVGGLTLVLIAASVPCAAALAAAGAPATIVQQQPAASPASDADPWNGRWSVSEVERDGERWLVRRNATAAALAGDPKFPQRIRITVPLPRGADYTPADDLNAIEARLVASLEKDRAAVGVLVLTTDVRREFVFYAADPAWAARAVADLGPQAAPYALTCEAAADPAWELYASFSP